MNVLICGDSFAADWKAADDSSVGWVNLLESDYHISNRAQAGCSEYKIYQQLVNENLDRYDCVIVCHTSPYRIPVDRHPLWQDDALHQHADLIYSDIKDKNDSNLHGIIDFFENYFDLRYAEFVHELIIKEQLSYLESKSSLHLCYYPCKILHRLANYFCFESIYEQHKGSVNHMDAAGNRKLFEAVDAWIKTQNP